MNSLKFSYYSGCREKIINMEYDELFDLLHRNSFDAIELLDVFGAKPLFDSIDAAVEFSHRLERENIRVSCYSVYIDIYENITACSEYLKGCLDFAVILNSEYFHHTLRIPFDKPHTYDIDEMISTAMPQLIDLAEYAGKYDMTILYEPQGFCFNGKNVGRLIHRLIENGVFNVGICLDLGNSMFCDYPPIRYVDELFSFIRHVHIKDYKICDGEVGDYQSLSGKYFVEVPYNKGDMQNFECISLLINKGYNGYFSTEFNPRGISVDDATALAIDEIRRAFCK